jgi:hypothetical protein
MNIVIFIFAFVIAISLFDSFNDDRKIFGILIARKNLSYSIKINIIILIYFAIFFQYVYYFTLLDSSSAIANIFLLLLIMPIPIGRLISRIVYTLLNTNKKFGSLTKILKFSMPLGQKFSHFLFVIIFSFIFIREYYNFSVTSDPHLKLIYFSLCFFVSLSFLIPLFDKIEFRERGICGSYFSLKWNEIEAYRLGGEDNILHIQHRSKYPLIKHLKFQVMSNKKYEIMAFLDSHFLDQNSR